MTLFMCKLRLTAQVSVAEGFGNILNYNFKKAFNNNTDLILIET